MYFHLCLYLFLCFKFHFAYFIFVYFLLDGLEAKLLQQNVDEGLVHSSRPYCGEAELWLFGVFPVL